MGSNSVDGKSLDGTKMLSVVNKDLLMKMKQKLNDPPKLLTKEAGKASCCIFRVPQRYVETNGKYSQPDIVSIGPYHRGDQKLQMIEEHKWRYLGSMLARLESKGVTLEDLFKAIEPLEAKSRECYSEKIHLHSDQFLEMMVLDGCFLIELFRKVGPVTPFEHDDPIITMAWILPSFFRDLIRLENQIPYFILESLFESTKRPGEEADWSLSMLALNFFSHGMEISDEIMKKCKNLRGRHLLDLVRSSYTQFVQAQTSQDFHPTPSHLIHSVSMLIRAGIKLRKCEADSFLVLKFRHRVIEMPRFTIDDTMTTFLLNCVAYEQCHKGCSLYFATYAVFLSCLVDRFEDVEYLSDQKIVGNFFGTNAEVAQFIARLGKDIVLDTDRCYLSELFVDVDQYYKNDWRVPWTSLRYTISVAAIFALLITLTQTFFTIYGTYKS